MAGTITLQHSTVNGGVAVVLNGGVVSYGWKNITSQKPLQGQYDIGTVEYAGFEHPQIVVHGIIDANSTPSNSITHALLLDFAQADTGSNDMTLTIRSGNGTGSSSYLRGRPSTGYAVAGNYTTSLKVQVVSFDINFGTPESEEGSMWNYTINLVETT